MLLVFASFESVLVVFNRTFLYIEIVMNGCHYSTSIFQIYIYVRDDLRTYVLVGSRDTDRKTRIVCTKPLKNTSPGGFSDKQHEQHDYHEQV